MGLVGKELFDAIAFRSDPAHEFADNFVDHFDEEMRPVPGDEAGRAGQHLHLHALDVDLQEVDAAVNQAVERPLRGFPVRIGHEMRGAEPGGQRRYRRAAAPPPRRRRSQAATRSTLASPFSATAARSAATARGCGSIGITLSASIDGGEEQRVVAGIGAGIDDAHAARQPFGQEAQLLLLEEEAAHLLALDHRIEPGIGEPDGARRRDRTGMKTGSRSQVRDEPRRGPRSATGGSDDPGRA